MKKCSILLTDAGREALGAPHAKTLLITDCPRAPYTDPDGPFFVFCDADDEPVRFIRTDYVADLVVLPQEEPPCSESPSPCSGPSRPRPAVPSLLSELRDILSARPPAGNSSGAPCPSS